MITESQKRTYILLLAAVAIIMIAAQYLLTRELETASEDLKQETRQLETIHMRNDDRRKLLERYKEFSSLVSPEGRQAKIFPTSALELFTILDAAMKENHIEHTNRSGSGGSEPGSAIRLQISFSGTHYGFLKALAALRESNYIMRISDIRLNADSGEKISGTMTVTSTARKAQ